MNDLRISIGWGVIHLYWKNIRTKNRKADWKNSVLDPGSHVICANAQKKRPQERKSRLKRDKNGPHVIWANGGPKWGAFPKLGRPSQGGSPPTQQLLQYNQKYKQSQRNRYFLKTDLHIWGTRRRMSFIKLWEASIAQKQMFRQMSLCCAINLWNVHRQRLNRLKANVFFPSHFNSNDFLSFQQQWFPFFSNKT